MRAAVGVPTGLLIVVFLAGAATLVLYLRLSSNERAVWKARWASPGARTARWGGIIAALISATGLSTLAPGYVAPLWVYVIWWGIFGALPWVIAGVAFYRWLRWSHPELVAEKAPAQVELTNLPMDVMVRVVATLLAGILPMTISAVIVAGPFL